MKVLCWLYVWFFIIRKTAAASVYRTAIACSFNSLDESKGFDLTYYSYSYMDTSDFTNPNYLASGYTTESSLGEASGVSDLSLSWSQFSSDSYASYYGMNVNVGHFVFEYTGFFVRMFFF